MRLFHHEKETLHPRMNDLTCLLPHFEEEQPKEPSETTQAHPRLYSFASLLSLFVVSQFAVAGWVQMIVPLSLRWSGALVVLPMTLNGLDWTDGL